MNAGQFFTPSSWYSPMPISIFGKPGIGPFAIANYKRALSHIGLYEMDYILTCIIWKLSQPNPPDSIASNFRSDYQDVFCSPRMIAWR
jgi:hypothetical protein